MASKKSRIKRIADNMDDYINNFSKKNKISYTEASRLAGELLGKEKFTKKKVIENIRRELEF